MPATAERGFAYLLVVIAFSALILCRFVDVPARGNVCFERNSSQQLLTYGFPFIGSPLTNMSVDPISGKDDLPVRLIGFLIRNFCVVTETRHRYSIEDYRVAERTQPIWLLKCAMLC